MSCLGYIIEIIGSLPIISSAKLLQVPGLYCHSHPALGLPGKRIHSTLPLFGYSLMHIFQHAGWKSRNNYVVDTGLKIGLGQNDYIIARI